MHSDSLPPSDRTESPDAGTPLSGDALRAAVQSLNLSNAAIATGIGKSSTTVNQWLNGKYPGDVAGVETAVREWLRDRRVASITGVPTTDTDVSRYIARKLEEIRQNAELAIITGPAGIGKSRAQSLYLRDHTLAIAFRVRPWHSGMSGLADDLARAADVTRLKKGEKRWETIIGKTKGSGRLLLVDDAHELGPRGLQCCVDYHDETGNPVALFGLPSLSARLLKDARRARRVGDVSAITCRDPRPLVEHLVDALAADAGAEREGLVSLAIQVAGGIGAFGAVEKQLKLASRHRARKLATGKCRPEEVSNGVLKWVPAFRAAHLHLLRQSSLN